jgi:hypothetical protein
MNIPLNDVQMDELIFRLDLDGDGQVDYHELCEGRRSLHDRKFGSRHALLSTFPNPPQPHTHSFVSSPTRAL